MRKGRLQTRGSLKTLPETTKADRSLLKVKMWQRHTLQDLARVYLVGNAGTNLDANTVTSTFLLNNCNASVLFDTGADRSFVSTAFSSQFDIAPTVLDHDYAVMGSFDVIIGMDWLSRYQAVIVCADKIVRIPWGRETLIFHGEGSNQEHETRLNIISCVKTQKYMLKG
uniref:Reverse transcriptase domain-containing protein n=1 Tax=Tanacetum cinerariifolium TaxID=118510 RepID=A0A699QSA0_TANCI|nr:hypothetical protein [Tanacetum cinerariifolium]